ncbi:hypothetical protein J6590_067143 [Homalodisca vitripennis]|nr:hypothetical protein J6590_067143 [Homalodisca vitripennis]
MLNPPKLSSSAQHRKVLEFLSSPKEKLTQNALQSQFTKFIVTWQRRGRKGKRGEQNHTTREEAGSVKGYISEQCAWPRELRLTQEKLQRHTSTRDLYV